MSNGREHERDGVEKGGNILLRSNARESKRETEKGGKILLTNNGEKSARKRKGKATEFH